LQGSRIASVDIAKRLKKRVLNTKSYIYKEINNALRLHLNECLYSPSPRVIEAVVNVVTEANLYPRLDMFLELRELLAKYVGVDSDMVYPFPGADSALKTLFYSFTDPGDTVVFLKPSFSMIEIYSDFFGLRKRCVELIDCEDSWIVDPEKLVTASKDSDLVVIDDPNNPTGSLVLGGDKELLERVALSTKGFVVIDETYHEFSGYTAAKYVSEFPNIVIVRSLSKSFCLAGFRLGYIVAHPDVVKSVTKASTTFDIPTPSLAAGIAAFKDLDYYTKIIDEVKQVREEVYRTLKGMGFKVYRSYANFLLVKDSRRLDEYLLSRGIAIKRVGENLFRIGIGSREAMKKFLETLGELA